MWTYSLRQFYLASLLLCVSGCQSDSVSAIPSDATFLGGKFPIYQRCERVGPVVQCQIWIDGYLDRDERFRTLDGGPTPTQPELDAISTASSLNRYMWVFLSNDRLLVPVSEYETSIEMIREVYPDELGPDGRWKGRI